MNPAERRIRTLAILGWFGVGLLAGRHAWLVFAEGARWRRERDRVRFGAARPLATRGTILDRDGRVLAEDAPAYRLEFVYRSFRRAHYEALLLHLDHLLRELAARAPGSLPPGLVSGAPLAYSDPAARFAAAVGGLLRLPARLLRRDALPRSLATALRFYVHACLAPLGGEGARPGARLVALRIDLAVPRRPQARLGALAAAAAGVPEARAAAILRAALARARAALDALAEVLGNDLALPFAGGSAARRRGGLRAWLDALDGLLARRAAALAARRRAGRAARRSARRAAPWWLRLLDLFGPPARPELSGLPLRLALRFRLERVPRPLAAEVPFDPVAALVLGRREDLPGFSLREELRRRHPRREPGGLPYRFLGFVGPKAAPAQVTELSADLPLPAPGEDLDTELARRRLHFTDPEWIAWKKAVRARLARAGARGLREGKTGLERSLDPWLAGLSGYRRFLKDRHGRIRGLYVNRGPVPGLDVTLELDAELCDLALEALRSARDAPPGGRPPLPPEQKAAIVVLDARTGAVLALAWLPRLVGRLPDRRNTAFEIWHYAVVGSSFKPFVAYELLASHGLDAAAGFVPCEGRIRFPGEPLLRCDGIHGRLTGAGGVVAAIAKSCNVWFAQAGRLLGLAGLQRAAARFGLWELGGAFEPPRGWRRDPAGPIPRRGQRPPHGRAKRAGLSFGALYAPVSEARRGIGYGLEATPLSLARAYAGLGTGRLPVPALIRAVGPERIAHPAPRGLDLRPEAWRLVRRGLERTTAAGGTAYRSGVGSFGLAGKTGTAEISRTRNNAWFSGYVPADEPRLALSAVFFAVPHGVHGGDHAATAVARFLAALAAPEHHRLWQRYLGDGRAEGGR